MEKYGAIHLSEDEWMKDLISMYDNDEMRDNIAGLHRKFASQLLTKSVNIVMDGGSQTSTFGRCNPAVALRIEPVLHFLVLETRSRHSRT